MLQGRFTQPSVGSALPFSWNSSEDQHIAGHAHAAAAGVKVRRDKLAKDRAGSSNTSKCFALGGVSLKGSQPCREGWWMRGKTVRRV
jgi:hypothetical protein